jgi:hypothetical protein
MLVHRRGWSPQRFQAWLTETFISQLVSPSPRPGAPSRTSGVRKARR